MYISNSMFWGGALVVMLSNAFLIIGFLVHYRKVDQDILEEDRKKLANWADRYAERKAQKLFKEYVENMRVDMRVELLNESDIDWG